MIPARLQEQKNGNRDRFPPPIHRAGGFFASKSLKAPNLWLTFPLNCIKYTRMRGGTALYQDSRQENSLGIGKQ